MTGETKSTDASVTPQETRSNPDANKPTQANTGSGGSWRGSGRRRGGNRGRNNRGANNRGQGQSQTKFKGSCPELEGHIFDIGPNQAAIFTKTQKEISAYASRRYSAEVGRAIETLDDQLHSIKIPQDPPLEPGRSDFTFTQKETIKIAVRQYASKKDKYEQGMKDIYNTIKSQCSERIKQVLAGQTDYLETDRDFDTLRLLRMLQRIAYNHRADQYQPYATLMAVKTAFLTRQPDDMSNSDWYEVFKNLIIAAEACGGSFLFPKIVEKIQKEQYPGVPLLKLTPSQKENVDIMTRELSLATLFIMNSNKQRYGQLRQDLENDFLKGHENYPANMVEAQKLLQNYKGLTRAHQQQSQTRRQANDGIAFAQAGNQQSGKSEARCWKCNKKGHFAYEGKCQPEDIAAFEALKQQQDNDSSTNGNMTSQAHAQPQAQSTSSDNIGMQQLNLGDSSDFDSYDDADAIYSHLFCQPCVISEEVEDSNNNNTPNVVPDVSYAHILSQSRGNPIDKNWLLLDNQSTVHVICNPDMLSGIHKINRSMYIHCNAGVTSTNLVGELSGVGLVWYHSEGIANIISLSKIRRTNRVTFDSHDDNVFRLYNKDGTTYRGFQESDHGLYYSNLKEQAVVMTAVETVEENKKKFSLLDRKRAKRARELQDILNITTKEMLSVIDNNHIPNCPVTRDDVRVAEVIHGPSLVGLKGKTVRRPEEHVRVAIKSLPQHITDKYMEVSLSADIMFVNGVRFFMTIARHLQFATCEMIGDARTETLVSSIQQIIKTYSKRGFTISNINMDIQFEPSRTELEAMGLNTNFVSRDEHVPEIERFIRTVKERTRGIQCTLPFKRYPMRLTVELVITQVFYWNALPKASGVSQTLSPRSIVTGLSIDYKSHCQLRFGQYVQTHEETDNNTGNERTVGAIALRPTGNQQGGYRFFSLSSGRVIRRNRWTELPMPKEVVDRMHKLSRRKQEGISFLDRNQQPFADDEDGQDTDEDDDDSSYNPSEEDDDDDDDDLDDQASIGDSVESTGVRESGDEEENSVKNTGVDSIAENETRSLRPSRQRTYNHLKTVGYLNHTTEGYRASRLRVIPTLKAYANAMTAVMKYNSENDPLACFVDDVILTQYNMRRGIKLFRQRGIDAVRKELKQMNDRNVAKPVSPESLTKEQRARALAYLMFLKEKRCGTIKGRGCADGRKQRNWMSKDDTASPTVSTAALMLSCLIDAYERRDVATTDIPGAFLQTPDKSTERTHLKFEGVMVEQLVQIDPAKYSPHVRMDSKGNKYMYAECLKAIYGTLNAALMFWQLLSGDLKVWGFEVNPYDSCVMNKTINGKQCTILWHVDDLKISHVDPKVVGAVLDKINEKYGKEAPITTTRGKQHDYLGMMIDYSTAGEVRFTMTDYIFETLEDLPKEMSHGEAATPAADHLFNIAENGVRLDSERAKIFHQLTAKLLFLSKRARPDIQLAVAFLCTRVKEPDEDDWKKLNRVLKYLQGSVGLPLVLSMDKSQTMRWYVDAAFAVHKDMRSHTGMTMTMGSGAALSGSRKQKINTRSSTEAELVGVDEELSMILWSRYFLLAQGYDIKDNIVYQDNQASMKLEKNGKKSSGKRTRHIDIRYFYVANRAECGDLSIKYCPTGDMIADYFTKPLQGSQFRRFRNAILGVDEVNIPGYNRNATEQRKAKLDKLKAEINGHNKPERIRDG